MDLNKYDHYQQFAEGVRLEVASTPKAAVCTDAGCWVQFVQSLYQQRTHKQRAPGELGAVGVV